MFADHSYAVYILANGRNGTLYVGVTNDLIRRVQEHREGLVPGFTKRHGVKLLVYFEPHTDINAAIVREKRIKRWLRRWKLELIERETFSGAISGWISHKGRARMSTNCHPGRSGAERNAEPGPRA